MSEPPAPQVSVVLPAFNAATTILAAARSILDDDSVELELIVIDDGSTDGTADAVQQLDRDPRVRVISRENRGLAASLNEGIAMARAPFIARMDADDVSLPGRLDRQSQFLREHADVVIVGGQIRRVVRGDPVSASDFPTNHDAILDLIKRGQHALCHPAVMMRRTALDQIGGYWSYGVAEDWDMYLRLAEIGHLANLDTQVLDYTFHTGGINASSMNAVRTNIGLAIDNHRRRSHGLPECDPEQYRVELGRRGRLRIRAEGMSLQFYRRSMLGRRESRAKASALLLAAAVMWPPFAFRRVSATVAGRRRSSG